MNTHTDTPVLMQAEEGVTLPAGHHTKERRHVTFQRHGANGLPDLGIHDNNLPRVNNEQVVFLSRRENDLSTVHLC